MGKVLIVYIEFRSSMSLSLYIFPVVENHNYVFVHMNANWHGSGCPVNVKGEERYRPWKLMAGTTNLSVWWHLIRWMVMARGGGWHGPINVILDRYA